MQYAHKNIVRLFPLKAEKKGRNFRLLSLAKIYVFHIYKQNEGRNVCSPLNFFNSVVYQSSDPLSKYSPGYNSPNFSVAVFSINSFVLIYSFFFFNSFFLLFLFLDLGFHPAACSWRSSLISVVD